MHKRGFLKQVLAFGAGTTVSVATLVHAEPLQMSTALRKTSRASLFPDLTLKTHDDRIVHFYDDLIKDKVVAFNFFYVSCRDSCPMTTFNLLRVQKLLGDRVGKDIFMYSISLDPDHDRPAVLQSYAELFKVRPGWTFLTGVADSGNQAEIDFLRRRLGFADLDPAIDSKRDTHTGMLRFGNEKRGQWGAMPAIMEPRLLAKELLWLVPDVHPAELRRLSQV